MRKDTNEALDPGERPAHQSLDPEDWSNFRALAHRMVDDMVDHLIDLRRQPVWQPVPDEVAYRLQNEELPRSGQGDDAVYTDFLTDVFPYRNGNLHPRFYGWVQGNGTPLANMADMLASVMNPHLAGYSQSPAIVERKVIAWIAEAMRFPPETSGVLESGGTMANILALAVARHKLGGVDIRKEGIQTLDRKLTVYCSAETHGWVQKGVEFLGIGTDWLRRIPANADYQIDIEKLRETIEADVNLGHQAICVIGTAGTVNTGAIDDLDGLADLCQDMNLWFHVDGAFGAMARLSPELAPALKGMERADSLAVDLHKWMYLPFEIACLLVRDEKAHTDTFAYAPSYLAQLQRGVIAGGLPFSDRGIDLTRGFKALKAWMCIKSYGLDKFADLIDQNVAQTRYLAKLVDAHPHLELLAPVPLNVACFRFNPGNMAEEQLSALNLDILLRVQESGLAVPSSTVVDGKFAIRFCNVNHRSRFEDIDLLIDGILEIGSRIA